MDRWLLNTLPFWSLIALVVAVGVAVGIGGYLAMRRWVPSLGANADSRSLSSAFSISSGLFSFVLAFTIGQLYSNFNRAVSDVKQEGAAVAQVIRVSEGLPTPLGRQLRAEALAYADTVRTIEWPLMERGRSSPAAWADIETLYATLERGRATRNVDADPFYAQTEMALDQLVVDRQTRLDDVNSTLPPIFQGLLVVGALLAISATFYFKPVGERLQVVMIGAASALVGLALLVAISLDYPYSGSAKVSSAPFSTQTLAVLSGDR